MGRMTMYTRRRIVALRQSGNLTIVKIQQRLLEEEGISVSAQSTYAFLRRYAETRSIADQPRTGRNYVLDLEQLDFIDHCMSHDPECSSCDLRVKLLERFNITVSLSTIKRRRRALGWIYTGTRYAQLVRNVNKPLREMFCLNCLVTGDRFDNVIFTDESSISMGSNLKCCFRRLGEVRQFTPKPKHPLKVHVWAGIAARGATPIYIFRGIMESDFYCQILETTLLPYINRVYPDGHRFQQDNDPKHTSRKTIAWMARSGVNYWPTPAESPDLNPIENIWAALKRHINRVAKPKNQEELITGITDFWQTLSPEVCQKYIKHLHKVMPAVISRNGAASGY